MISVLIPAKNEPYLQQTIDDLFKKAHGDIEVIVLLDGWWPKPILNDDKRQIIVHRGAEQGMRAAINSCARIAKGEYLMKLDAHCAVSEGFDEALLGIGKLGDGDVLVPVRYRLDVDKWDRKGEPRPPQYIERGSLKGRDWPEYITRTNGQNTCPIMTSQGSCWFMSRKWWDHIGGLDQENYGSMGREAQEVCLKTWTMGGLYSQINTCWYAHWDKPAEHVIRNKGKEKSVAYAQAYWTEDKIRPVIDKFTPVPTWDEPIIVQTKEPVVDPVEHIRSKQPFTDDANLPIVLKGVNREGLYKIFAELGYKVGCEVGVQRGRNAAVLLDSIPGLKLYLVEPWANMPSSSKRWSERKLREFKRQTKERLKGRNVVYLEDFSERAVHKVDDNSLDFVYIDADHAYDYVMLDIILWSRKVRKGGIISGHDYYYTSNRQSQMEKVTGAVRHYTTTHMIRPWFITDRGNPKQKGDGFPSWLWIKT